MYLHFLQPALFMPPFLFFTHPLHPDLLSPDWGVHSNSVSPSCILLGVEK